jgi:hypothetical protein
VRAQNWGCALPPPSLNVTGPASPVASSVSSCSLPRRYFWFWSSKNKNAFSSSHDSRSLDLPRRDRKRQTEGEVGGIDTKGFGC